MTFILNKFLRVVAIVVFAIVVGSCNRRCAEPSSSEFDQSFYDAASGLLTFNRWVYADGKGNGDTLLAKSSYFTDLVCVNDICICNQHIYREYSTRLDLFHRDFTMFASARGKEYTLFSVHPGFEPIYSIENEDFINCSTVSNFDTPLGNFDNVKVFSSLREDVEKVYYVDSLGVVGYIHNSDTLKIVQLL